MPASLDCPDDDSATGAYQLRWSNAGDAILREDGALVYEGEAGAIALSGREPGTHTYELQVDGGEVLGCEVTVDPPELWLALAFFAAGALVFAATCGLLWSGHARARRERAG